MEKIHELAPASRYKYDSLLCPKGYAQVDTWQDASYYGTWANPRTLVIFAYVEGDCYTTICETVEEFISEIMVIKEWNNRQENGGFKGIDPGLNPDNIQQWHAIGLGDLLH